MTPEIKIEATALPEWANSESLPLDGGSNECSDCDCELTGNEIVPGLCDSCSRGLAYETDRT